MFSEELKLLFTNYSFFVFLGLLFTVYFVVPKKAQWVVLLVASYVFYFLTSSALPVYMMITTVTVYFAARFMDKIEQDSAKYIGDNKETLTREERKEYKNKTKKRKRVFLIPTVIINIGLLVVLKYGNMMINTVNGIFSSNVPLISLIVPLGISYYTLQSVGYLVDVYQSKYPCEKNIAKFALFVSFFAQIIQGPFSRFSQLGNQLFESHDFSYDRLKSGAVLMLWGYFKKLVIADTVGLSVAQMMNNVSDFSGPQLLFGTFLYSAQVYADFSGYMDIASGSCEILGIELVKNFDRPYFSKSVQEFWRRWHITLGNWFKDYVFFPLSVSKVSVTLSKKCRNKGWLKLAKLLPSYIAMLFVWSLTGLWHGADWKYMLWGAGNCVFILINLQFETTFETMKSKLKIKESNFFWRSFQIIRTFLTVSLLRVCSRTNTVSDAGLYYKRIFTMADFGKISLAGFFPKMDIFDIAVFLFGCALLYIISLLQFKYPEVRKELFKKNYFVQLIVIMALIFFIILFGKYGSGIDVGGFIYAQF